MKSTSIHWLLLVCLLAAPSRGHAAEAPTLPAHAFAAALAELRSLHGYPPAQLRAALPRAHAPLPALPSAPARRVTLLSAPFIAPAPALLDDLWQRSAASPAGP